MGNPSRREKLVIFRRRPAGQLLLSKVGDALLCVDIIKRYCYTQTSVASVSQIVECI